MRNRLFLLLALAAILAFAAPAFATNFGDDHTCQGSNNCNETDVDSHDVTDSHDITNNATGGSVGNTSATGGNSTVGSGFGSFSPHSDADADADATVSHSGNSDVDVDTNVGNGHGNFSPDATSIQGQHQGQVQGQQQGQAQVSDDDVTIEGDHYEAPDMPVNSAAPVFAGACSQGVSGQGMGFGASAATGNPVCDYVAVAGAYVAAGDREHALDVLAKAEDAADWRGFLAKVRGCLTLGLL